MHEFVVGGTQFGVTGETPKACHIDQRLRMFDTKADGKGFGLEEYAPLLQHAQRIAGAVPEREHDVTAVQRLAARKLSSRIVDTTPVRRKVPMCGLLT